MKTRMKFKWVATLALLIFISQNQVLAQSGGDILTNESIIKMTNAGLPKSLILAKIQSSHTNFDVSIDTMIDLKKKGVDDDVLTAMTNKASSGNVVSGGSANLVGATKIENILIKAEPGIYFADENTNQPTEIDPNIFSGTKKGSGIATAMSYGIAKTTQKSILNGPHANLVISNLTPTFYFVFPRKTGSDIGNESNGASGFYDNASSPNEFVLAKFRIVKMNREVETGSYGTYSGFSMGIEERSKVPFHYLKIAPGLYKITFDPPLTGGEYAFVFSGTATIRNGETPTQKAFDFSYTGRPDATNKKDDSRRRPPNPLNVFKKKSEKDSVAKQDTTRKS